MTAATRRRALGSLAAAGAVLAPTVPPAVAAAEQDPHPEWWRQREALNVQMHAVGDDDDAIDPLQAQVYHLEDRIAQTPARTYSGVLAQLRVARHYQWVEKGDEGGSWTNDPDIHSLVNAIATLERLAEGRA
jgi:hypothetical protein